MPARRISVNITIGEFDVLGSFAGTEETAIRHVGLATGNQTVHESAQLLNVAHMRPPLLMGQMGAEFVGNTQLSANARRKIQVFLDDQLSEDEAARERRSNQSASTLEAYIIHPAFERRTKDYASHKYSCAGFVQRAYSLARINLVAADALLPDIELDTIAQIYPQHAMYLARPLLRREFGLNGDGPWRVLFPGYLMKSLARSYSEISSGPYQPSAEDIRFLPA